ncbi:MAG: hypothetical protein HKP30_03480 [Myxococcales bacterium]|nr:hypothetical protein [Myxococcales bacterium]
MKAKSVTGPLFDVGFLLLLVSLVWVPSPAALAGAIFSHDLLFHWDHFVVGPAIAFGHGMPLGTEIYSQYGLGWPVLVDALAGEKPLPHRTVLALSVGYAVLVHAGLYFLLRALVGWRSLAAAGVLLALVLSLFAPMLATIQIATLWTWPSLTVLRAPMEVWFFVALLAHTRRPTRATAAAAGLLAGLALFFETDTGIFLCATGLAYAALRAVAPAFVEPGARAALDPAPRGSLAAAVLAATWVLVPGMVWASHGTLFSQPADFLAGWIGGVLNSSDRGVGAKYLATFLHEHGAYLGAAFASLGVGLLAVGWTLARGLHGRLDPDTLLAGCIGLYAVSRCTLFVWRTVPVRLTLVAIPAAILATMALAALCRQRPGLGRIAPPLALLLTAFAVLSSPAFARYPNLWRAPTEASAAVLPGHADLLAVEGPLAALVPSIEALVRDVEERVRRGEDVAVLDPVKTLVYASTGARPWIGDPAVFANAWFRQDVLALSERLARDGPRHVYVRSEEPVDRFRDSWRVLRSGLPEAYRRAEAIGRFERWERRPAR